MPRREDHKIREDTWWHLRGGKKKKKKKKNFILNVTSYFKIFIYLKPLKGKGKAIPLQAWTGPKGSRRLRLPDFKTIST